MEAEWQAKIEVGDQKAPSISVFSLRHAPFLGTSKLNPVSRPPCAKRVKSYGGLKAMSTATLIAR